MTYCAKCGTKNEDNAEFCKKCGASLTGLKKEHGKDDDCVCSGSKQNPMVPVFWGIVVILIGLWIVITYVLELPEFTFGGLIILIIAIAIMLTGFRIMTKK
jgi:uncharacterized membrane protein YvbJ